MRVQPNVLLAGLRPAACRVLTSSRADRLQSHVQGASPMSGRSRGTAAGQAPLTPVQLTPTSQDTPPSPEQQQFLQSLGRQEQQVGCCQCLCLTAFMYVRSSQLQAGPSVGPAGNEYNRYLSVTVSMSDAALLLRVAPMLNLCQPFKPGSPILSTSICAISARIWKMACVCCGRTPPSKQRRVRAAALPAHPLHASSTPPPPRS